MVTFTTQLLPEERERLNLLSAIERRPVYQILQAAVKLYIRELPEDQRHKLKVLAGSVEDQGSESPG